MARRKKYYSAKAEFATRAVRSVSAVVILTALVLGISYFVRELSTLDPTKLVRVSAPILAKVGVSEEKAGEVAGKFAKRIGETNIGFPDKDVDEEDLVSEDDENVESDESNEEDIVAAESERELFSVAILADSHNDNERLTKALERAEELSVSAVFHIGDLTDLGITENLRDAKKTLDESATKYYAIPGDRDLWQSVGPDNFTEVFGKNYYKVTLDGYKFVILDNSANYTVVEEELIEWFGEEVEDADFVLLAQPLYHPTNDKVMGNVNDETVADVREQAIEILTSIRESDVKAIFAADHHKFSESADPEDEDLVHFVMGAITEERNLQTPRLAVLKVFDGGDYEVEQIVLD